MTAVTRYFEDIAARLDDLATTQADAIEQTATLIAGAVAGTRPVHIYDSGHLIGHEFIARTGGLAGYTLLTISAGVGHDNEWISANRSLIGDDKNASDRALVSWVLDQGTIRAGDVLVVSSVSGTGGLIVELARQARERGVHVVAVTGAEFSGSLTSGHPSGKRLFEVAEVVLDNRVPIGDSMLEIDGLVERVAPWSGIAGATLLWAATSRAVELAVESGTTPTVFTSVNLPDGMAAYSAARARYRETGR